MEYQVFLDADDSYVGDFSDPESLPDGEMLPLTIGGVEKIYVIIRSRPRMSIQNGKMYDGTLWVKPWD